MEEVTLGAGKTFKEPTNSLTVTMLVDTWITKDGSAPLPEAVNITAEMPAEVKPNPTAYAPETDALDYWESLEGMLTVVKKPHVLGPQYKGDIYVLGEDFTGLPLNNIGGLNLRPLCAKYSDDPDLCWESICRKSQGLLYRRRNRSGNVSE